MLVPVLIPIEACFAQTVTNVTARQVGQELVISYTLTTSSPCEVSLFISIDRGRNWQGPKANCSGDIGKHISAGDRQIRWAPLDESDQLIGDGIQFKVVASSRKSFEPEMVFVEGGRFMMGSTHGDDDERPVHKVKLSSFAIGKYEVTQAQWKALMGSNPSHFNGCDQCPVENVSWIDVQGYIRELNKQTGKSYRLPTEAEWEYAARGGNRSEGTVYAGSNAIGEVAWYDGNSPSGTNPVGIKKANELGIFDMSGNVWEWCSDSHGGYSSSYELNPKGVSSGTYRVLRGGSWRDNRQALRVANRGGGYPNEESNSDGFRLVLAIGQ
jgi:formylglycine-generating enzyme required for sulfatase activity